MKDVKIEAIVTPRTRAELEAELPRIAAVPKDRGRLDLIVSRPSNGLRDTPDRVAVSAAGGIAGDHWAKGCWMETEDGKPHPDVQVCMMSSPVIRAIAGGVENWAPAGDNLFLDLDLSPSNMPPGTRFAIGSAEFEVTAVPHNGCAQFIARYGRDACVFVNTGPGRSNRMRGIYARVTKDGEIAVGDVAVKL
ncbi:MOSC domain-containing protein [Rhodobacterales bacterium HKCCE2091]|nr:MOSC domain-containing protein [Rhodobacterales bacterium HKCCE2091]